MRGALRLRACLLAMGALVLLCACSRTQDKTPPTGHESSAKVFAKDSEAQARSENVVIEEDIEVFDDKAPKPPPVSVKIAQAFVADGNLNVKVHLQPKTSIDTSKIVVSVLGLRDGDVAERQDKRLNDVVHSKELDPERRVALMFQLPNSGLTEYQVRCSWGDDAKEVPVIEPKSEPVELASVADDEKSAEPEEEVITSAVSDDAGLEIQDLSTEKQVVECDNQPCDSLYTLRGRLVNSSNSAFSEIQLALGLFWVTEGSEPRFPAAGSKPMPNEELIDLKNAVLLPGQSKKLRVSVDRALPQVPGGEFVPHLRLISFERDVIEHEGKENIQPLNPLEKELTEELGFLPKEGALSEHDSDG